MPLAAALRAPVSRCPQDKVAGRVSASYLWAYPPGSPLLVPGERIDEALIAAVEAMRAAGVRLLSAGGNPPESWAVIAE